MVVVEVEMQEAPVEAKAHGRQTAAEEEEEVCGCP